MIITSVGAAGYDSDHCGLQWAGGSGVERNAKFDCDPAWDAFSMVELRRDIGKTSVNGSWAGSGGRNAYAGGNTNYQLTVESDGSVEINLTSSTDTYLYLLDANGSIIASDDDGGSGYNSKLVKTLAAGTYTAVAATYSSGQSGSFTLTTNQGGLLKK